MRVKLLRGARAWYFGAQSLVCFHNALVSRRKDHLTATKSILRIEHQHIYGLMFCGATCLRVLFSVSLETFVLWRPRLEEMWLGCSVDRACFFLFPFVLVMCFPSGTDHEPARAADDENDS